MPRAAGQNRQHQRSAEQASPSIPGNTSQALRHVRHYSTVRSLPLGVIEVVGGPSLSIVCPEPRVVGLPLRAPFETPYPAICHSHIHTARTGPMPMDTQWVNVRDRGPAGTKGSSDGGSLRMDKHWTEHGKQTVEVAKSHSIPPALSVSIRFATIIIFHRELHESRAQTMPPNLPNSVSDHWRSLLVDTFCL